MGQADAHDDDVPTKPSEDGAAQTPESAPREPLQPPPPAVPDRADPTWFRTSLFPSATAAERARTVPDSAGLLASSILFTLPEDQTAKACADHLEQEVRSAVPNLAGTQLQDGRYELRGDTDRYSVVMQCGQARDGPVRAYVSFQWTS